jgi:S-adenosyl-L-methionine hydrolase (adenosine-forming)
MILLFTDFGLTGPYTGQMKAVLARHAPGVVVIDLMADAPAFAPRPAAYLLAALADQLPPPCVFLCVVDPGVGTARRPIALNADGKIFVGPDNGLPELVRRRGQAVEAVEILWRPARLSASFHGRDLFAPIAARLAMQGWDIVTAGGAGFRPLPQTDIAQDDWPDDWPAAVYVDPYGNVMSGVRAASVAPDATFQVGDVLLPRARTFADVPPGAGLVYENSCGLLEISVNSGSAAAAYGLKIGDGLCIRAKAC